MDQELGAGHIPWDAVPLDSDTIDLLPNMQTDISLTSTSRKIIIDAKYYKEALQKYYDKKSIRSAHLYQIFAYLMNIEHLVKDDVICEGILLYPTVESELDYSRTIKGHRITVKTINLNQEWKCIHDNLLNIIN